MTDDAARDRGITWSSDGKTLYFSSNRDGNDHLWSIRADGSGLTRLTDDADLRRYGQTGVYAPVASPDGRTLAARTSRSAVLVHLDRPLNQRTEVFGQAFLTADWSPEGRRLLCTMSDGTVAIYSLDTRTTTKILDRAASAQWLPDGRHVAFVEKGSVGVLDLDRGSPTLKPFQAPSGVELTRMSKDGSTIYLLQTTERGDIWLAQFRK